MAAQHPVAESEISEESLEADASEVPVTYVVTYTVIYVLTNVPRLTYISAKTDYQFENTILRFTLIIFVFVSFSLVCLSPN